eukprot:TRINITY_DN506_c0_g2_i2.p1 TRINITY_DN506_c0_g2~~TRINITY_DN506_c0_g2_i2.p1  ORF type:complete len:295 (-),score=58.11 TRINITY_DN506_c0_g2_i2:135-1019(-)
MAESFERIEEPLETVDGIKLRTKSWKPKDKAKCTVTFVHGLGEHIDRYDHVFSNFADAGIVVNTFDQRGFGKSEGPKSHTPSLEHTLTDIDMIVSKADTTIPHFVYGHSLGGCLALHYSIKNQHKINGVMVTAPLIKIAFPPPPVKLFFGRLFSHVLPSVTVSNELNPSWISRDAKLNEDYMNDPLVRHDVSLRLASSTFDWGEQLLGLSSSLNIPLFIVHGDADKITSSEASKLFFEGVSSNDKTLRILEGFFHEVHNEPEKEEVINSLRDWILARANAEGSSSTSTSSTLPQ